MVFSPVVEDGMDDPFRKRFSTSLGRKLTRFLAKQEKSRSVSMATPRPMASFTFDDVPASAHINGARVLDSHGVKGTFYIASGTCGTEDTHWQVISEAQVADLHTRGHEIGCHTFSHVNVHTLSVRELAFECDRNATNLMRICGPSIRLPSFCYPFGDLGYVQKRYLQERFVSCRSIYEGLNIQSVDLGMVLVVECYDATLTPEKLAATLAEAKRTNAWIVFYTHDVTDDPTYMGCSPALLSRTVAALIEAGIEITPMSSAVQRLGLGQPSTAIAA
jgi:peptidoglycan/xylan/chitin deacetylase (PgdA/CDA1 family)